MIAITRIEQLAMSLPTFGTRGFIVQEDFFAELDTSLGIFDQGRWYNKIDGGHYYDVPFDPITDDAEYHHYHCLNPDCQYCQLVEHAIRHSDYTLAELVSYALFIEVYPLILDEATDEYYRDIPNNFISPSNMRAIARLWQEESSDDSYSSDDDGDYDSDDGDYYDDSDTDDYTYGYDSSDYCNTPRDQYMLRRINWHNIRIIGAGQSAVTLTDGKYAIKVGNISKYDINTIESAARDGFSVPVFYFAQNRKVSKKILDVLRENMIPKYGDYVSWSDYVNAYSYKADVAVLGLAEPLMNHASYDGPDNARAIAARLAREYANATGKRWSDAHQFNMGYYNGGLVILDF